MSLPVATFRHTPLLASVRVDCSRAPAGERMRAELQNVLDWIADHPSTSSVHVTLRSVLSGSVPRKYQAMLQSLGCTVTARVACA